MKGSLAFIHHSSLITHHSSFIRALPHGRASALSSSPLVNQRGDEARPARLVRGAEAHARVAVEVFVEEQEVAPVRVFLTFAVPAVHGPAAFSVAREDAYEAVGEAA